MDNMRTSPLKLFIETCAGDVGESGSHSDTIWYDRKGAVKKFEVIEWEKAFCYRVLGKVKSGDILIDSITKIGLLEDRDIVLFASS